MYSASVDHTGSEWYNDILPAISGGLQIHTGRKHHKKWSLASEVSLQCSVVDVAANADINMVTIKRAS